MPIITHSKQINQVPSQAFYTQYPDQFVSLKQRQSDDYIRLTLDYFYSIALQQYNHNVSTFVHNYRLVKGILRKEDFYEHSEVKSYVDNVLRDEDLPDDIQHYSIFNPVLNTMVGEMSKRPDNSFIKAFDDDSKAEELQFKTEILNQYIIQKVQEKISIMAAQQGIDMDTEEGQAQVQQMTEEELADKLSNYTSQAEKWANRMLENLKMQFNLKEQSEEAFRDLLISGRERFHIYEDKSKIGFNVECVNPKNTWYLSTPDKKYMRDSFAAGIIEVMELSEIIRKYPLTKKEIDHLREINRREGYIPYVHTSNLYSGKTGINSVQYDTYDPGVLQIRQEQEARMLKEQLDAHLGITNTIGTLGEKFVVVTSYFILKNKVGKLTYINEEGQEEITLVDENYKSGEHPQQLDLEWGYVDQWYRGLKISDVYYLEPLKILDYCPIIGVDFEKRNTEVKSLIDMMKPFQAIYNLNVNQLWRIAQKEYGVVFALNPRKVPVAPDGTEEDAVEIFKYQMQEEGIALEDDSPENMKAPSSNTQVARRIDLTRTGEMTSRIQNAQWAKQECWELVGINRERLGGTLATQTASGAQANLSQSYAQTEPLFTQHEYTMQQLYQAILDTAQYIESHNPTSTVSWINGEGEHAFITINGSDLSLRDLRIYATSRGEDQRQQQELKALLQPILQNGGSPAAVAEIIATKSNRKMIEVLNKVDEQMRREKQQAMQLEQQKIQAQQEAIQAQIQAQQQQKLEDRAYDAQQKELDRANKVQIAAINASSRNPSAATEDANGNGLADYIENTRLSQEINSANRQYDLETQKIQGDAMTQQIKLQNEQNKAKVEKEKFEAESQLKKEELRIKEKAIDTSLKVAKANKSQ